MAERVVNFSAGPAVLPVAVLEQAQRNLVAVPGAGMSVMEMSHRSKAFEAILAEARVAAHRTAGDSGRLQGIVLARRRDLAVLDVADELPPRQRTARRLHHHRNLGRQIAGRGQARRGHEFGLGRQSPQLFAAAGGGRAQADSGAPYVHFTSNETIQGVQFAAEPDVQGVRWCATRRAISSGGRCRSKAIR